MADPSRHPDTGGGTGARPTTDRPPSTPRWVKVSGIIAIVVILLVVTLMLIGGGEHGPGRHTPSGDAGGRVPSSSVVEDHAPPEDGRG